MLKCVILAGCVALVGGAALAEENQAAASQTDLVPVVTREVCTTSDYGVGEIRTECRTETIPAPKVDPKMKGICTTFYGKRTCY
jgi:hypothetical protein